MLRLRVFATHPVQYHVPLWRLLSLHPGLALKVLYLSDHGVRPGLDPGFGLNVSWDVDLLSGYESEFLSRDVLPEAPASARISHLDDVLRRERADWIWLSGYNMPFHLALRRAALKHAARLIMRAEFNDLSFGHRSRLKSLVRAKYLRWFYSGVDRFCFPGVMARQHLLAHGVSPDKLHFSPYSVDTGLIERSIADVSRSEARAALGIPESRFVLLFSGKLIPRKDPMAVLDSLQLLGAEANRIGLIVLGDGELRPMFEPRARTLLGDRLVFPGFVNQSQLGRYFRAADALVMPSLHETWGLVVNEAMHYGLPCIVSDMVGCGPDLIRPGETGFIFPAGDRTALAAQISSLAQSHDRKHEMGRSAQALAEHYQVDASARGVFEALGL